ncbi:ABC transporter permease [Streptomyces sp. NBC_00006]|uniref:ABC transporter permease n=1 Tax=unclassified Streptomyces TaxID=2593676 RepID=UPI002259A905|nr:MULTISPECIES: ABC transporter permease [unclassified Streptomyces]MCX4829122.1 ABC transporter permease [Streptomyces sp. NBC_01016]MCX5531528.1 ABC transporter permease [Streptomyces sp. NBC_00006]
MGRYVARRLLQMIPVFLGTTILIFLMVNVLPGDPVAALWGDKPPDPAQMAKIKHDLGLDLPLWQQYLHYLGNLAHGEFGVTIAGSRPVIDEMAAAFPVTIRLALMAFTFEMVVGICLGVIAGIRRGKLIDTGVTIFTLLVISVPVFVLGLLGQQIIGTQLGWVTPNVQDSMNVGQLLLPAIVLGSLSLAYVARLTRTSIAENARADYIRTAVAKGLPQTRVVRMHLLRNSLIPVVTYLGTDIGALMAGAVVTEGIFNVQGVGNLLYEALARREGAVIVGIVTVFVLIYLVANLVVDLLYAVLDPRIRYA